MISLKSLVIATTKQPKFCVPNILICKVKMQPTLVFNDWFSKVASCPFRPRVISLASSF